MQPETQAVQTVDINPINAALQCLQTEGYKVVDMKLFITHPTVMVEADPRLAQMVAERRACYYVQSPQKRVGQLHVEGVRVIWIEEVQ